MNRHPRVPVKFATRVSENRPRLRQILDTANNGQMPEGSRAPLFPDAFCKCEECGATLRTRLDHMLHVSVYGVCIARSSGQKPRIDRIQAVAPESDTRSPNPHKETR